MHYSVFVFSKQNSGISKGGESRTGPGNAVKWMESEEKSEGTLSNFFKDVCHMCYISWIVKTTSRLSLRVAKKTVALDLLLQTGATGHGERTKGDHWALLGRGSVCESSQ